MSKKITKSAKRFLTSLTMKKITLQKIPGHLTLYREALLNHAIKAMVEKVDAEVDFLAQPAC
jgi:3-methyladenine DNA glycosylase AlkD